MKRIAIDGRGAGRIVLIALLGAGLAGCRSASSYRAEADRAATNLVRQARAARTGRTGPFSVERPSDTLRRRLMSGQGLPGTFAAATNPPAEPPGGWKLSLVQALQVGSRNSREYQDAKETVFAAALKLDLEADAFRTSFAGVLSSVFTDDRSGKTEQRGVVTTAEASAKRKWENGATVTSRLAVDVAKLLTLDRKSAFGLLADATVTIPLLRGAGRDIVREPMTQAEHDLCYAIYALERFRSAFAVKVATAYLGVLQQRQQILNLEENWRSLTVAAKRAQAMSAAGRVSQIEVDQGRQDELRALDRLNTARHEAEQQLDLLKIELGLPTDARIEVDDGDLTRTPEPAAASAAETLREEGALRAALTNRFDLAAARGAVEDARRAVKVAEDALRADVKLTLSGSAGDLRTLGTADKGDARLSPSHGTYGAKLESDLPWHRTLERNAYRASLLAVERAVRDLEQKEDEVKLDVRNACRRLGETREAYTIQKMSLDVAQRRVDSTDMLQQAGRAVMRDMLEARESLLNAQNAVPSARVQYRLAELALERDTETLAINEEGLWDERNTVQP